MDEISLTEGIQIALQSLIDGRLTVLAGAGLSMAPPTSMPSAPALAAQAKARYAAIYGATRDALPDDIEEQAEHFFSRGELATTYLRTLIGQHTFSAPPNLGHFAIADLLLISAIKTAVTTNVDNDIEVAGVNLRGRIGAGIGGTEVMALPAQDCPLLKLHGCHVLDWDNMVWAPSQLTQSPVRERIASSAAWLSTRLPNRDVVIVGFWTDWDYLNSVLGSALGTISPARVIVVDLAPPADFAAKAPDLYQLGRRAGVAFKLVRVSGDKFLDELRIAFSKTFVRRMLHSGSTSLTDTKGISADATLLEPPDGDSNAFWLLRRDIEGCKPNEPCKLLEPPEQEVFVGQTLLQLRIRGAAFDSGNWVLDGKRIRVIRTPNQSLHAAASVRARESAPLVSADVIIAVGAEAVGLPPNIARGPGDGGIARGSSPEWKTRSQAEGDLGL